MHDQDQNVLEQFGLPYCAEVERMIAKRSTQCFVAMIIYQQMGDAHWRFCMGVILFIVLGSDAGTVRSGQRRGEAALQEFSSCSSADFGHGTFAKAVPVCGLTTGTCFIYFSCVDFGAYRGLDSPVVFSPGEVLAPVLAWSKRNSSRTEK